VTIAMTLSETPTVVILTLLALAGDVFLLTLSALYFIGLYVEWKKKRERERKRA